MRPQASSASRVWITSGNPVARAAAICARNPRSCASRRTVLVEIIQPRLAQGHDLGVPRQFDQFAGRDAVFFVGVMRMGADRAIDVRKSLRYRQQLGKTFDPRRDGDDAPDPGSIRACDDGVEIFGEVRKIEMAMAVDKHRLTVQAAVGSI